MIKAIIIDDEKSSRITLENMVSEFCEGIDIMASADSVATGVEAINKYAPDLVFLDVEMPVYNGFTRSDLVNLNHVERFGRQKSPSVTLSDDTILAISLRRKEAFLKAIKGL